MNAEDLQARFAEVQAKIEEILVKAFFSTKSNSQVRAIVAEDLEKMLVFLKQGSTSFVDTSVVEEFIGGASNTIDQLLAARFVSSAALQFDYLTDFTKAPANFQDSVKALIEDYNSSFDDAYRAARSTTKQSLNAVLRVKDNVQNAKDILTAAERNAAVDSIKAKAARETFGGKSIDTVAKEAAKELKTVIKRDSGIMFRDRAGRRWSFERYANMMTSEVVTTSHREGQFNQFVDLGVDVVTTNDTGTTDTCLVWQGKLLSLTGVTPGLPTYASVRADGTHMFSVGCLHELIYLPQEEVAQRLGSGNV